MNRGALRRRFVARCEERRQNLGCAGEVEFPLEFPDVARLIELIEEAKVEAEACNHAGGIVPINSTKVFSKQTPQRLRPLSVFSPRMTAAPFVGHPLK